MSIIRCFTFDCINSIFGSAFKKIPSFLIVKTFRSIKNISAGDFAIDVSSANQSELLSNGKVIGLSM